MAGAMRIPVERINTKAVELETTYSYLPMGGEEEVKVAAFFYDGDYLCVPRHYGLELCNRLHLDWEDHTSQGFDGHWPRIPTPRDYQVENLEAIQATFKEEYDFLFRAHTGWGKTIGALIVAARMGGTTLIVVDQDNLKDQWVERLVDPKLFGFKKADIGLIQGKRCDYKGKTVVIAMVQTLAQKMLPAEVYDYFRLVIVDEVHTIGAPTFSRVLTQFSATYRLGVSATPKRKDGLQKALDHNLGPVLVAADKEHDESAVYIIYHDTIYSWYANVSPKVGRILTEVADDGFRNLKLADAVVWLYESGRDVVVMGDRIEQVKDVMNLIYYMGVPEDHLGLYTGEDPKWMLAKDTRPTVRPTGYVRRTAYTPLKYQQVRKKIPKARLESVKGQARIIFATYGMFAKGVDVPRLTGGADATPRSAAEQQVGRIKRGLLDAMPIWVTIVDRNNYRLLHSFYKRAQEYIRDNSRLYVWGDDGGLTECDPERLLAETKARVKELKCYRIETNSDGLNTLEINKSAKDKKQEHATAMREWAARHSHKESPKGVRVAKSPGRIARTRPRSRLLPSRKRPKRSGNR